MRNFLFFLIIVLTACQDTPVEQPSVWETKMAAADSVLIPQKLVETDSIQLVYYPEPGNQKYHREQAITDSVIINEMMRNFNSTAITTATCAMDTRLFCFDKDGNLIKTIYAATKGDCTFIAFTGNGGINYYYPISTVSLTTIRQIQQSFKLD
jgi:hypothetical protein